MELGMEIREKAIPYDGVVPDNWEFLGMAENNWNYFRYYRDSKENYYYTTQKKKNPFKFDYQIREENGNLFARKILPKKRIARQGYK